jgi:hypothetical protein
MPLIRQAVTTGISGKKDLRELLDPQILGGSGSVELEFARSPLVDAAGSVRYLLSYPHGCLEQTTSSLMPWLAVEKLRKHIPTFAKLTDKEIQSAIQAGADRLLSMQRPDGSFSYWPGSTDTVDWATPYAALGLVLAVERGAQVPQSAIDSLTAYLSNSLRGVADVKSPSALEIHSRSLLALAIAKSPQPAYQNLLRDRLPELTSAARAMLAAAICHSADGDPRAFATARGILGSKVAIPAPENTWSPGNAAAPLQLMAWVAIDPNAPETAQALDRLGRQQLVLHELGRMPRRGEAIEIGGLELKVQRADRRRIETLRVTTPGGKVQTRRPACPSGSGTSTHWASTATSPGNGASALR